MSSQQVTLAMILDKWRVGAGHERFEETQEEMESLFAEAKAIGATAQDIVARRDTIVGFWYPLSWREAQDRYDHWRDKKKYERMRNSMLKLFADLVKHYYPEEFKKVEQSSLPKTSKEPQADQDIKPRITSKEELDLWKKAGKPKTDREWLAWKAANPNLVPKDAIMPNVVSMSEAKKRLANGV